MRTLILILLLISGLAAHAAAPTFDFLKSSQLPAKGDADRLTLIFYRAPNTIKWTSPGELARTAIWNTLSGHINPLSHFDVYLSCQGQEPVLTGMSRIEGFDNVMSILFGGQSMDLLVKSYPGYLIPKSEIMGYLPNLAAKGEVRSLSFLISKPACERLTKFHQEYAKRGYGTTYSGFTSNPFRGEGAGCAAFGMSFLKVAGLLEPEFVQSWTRRLRVPTRLVHSPSRSADVGFWGFMLFGRNEAWAGDKEEAVDITAFDPELMYDWVKKTAARPAAWEKSAQVFNVNGVLEILVDKSRAPVPTDDYWSYAWPPLVK